jgi:hypothetical protein
MSSTTFSYEFNYEAFRGKVNFPTGLFIDGQFTAGSNGTTIEYVIIACTSYLYFALLIRNPVVSSILVSRLHSNTELQMF